MKNWKFTANSFVVFEKTGLIPRSIYKFFQNLLNQFDPLYEYEIVKNFRITKYQTLVFFRYTLTVLFIPLIFATLCKKAIFVPAVNNLWSKYDGKIFLNSTQEHRAYEELQEYNNELVFHILLHSENNNVWKVTSQKNIYQHALKLKAQELAEEYSNESKEAISNVLTDITSLLFFVNILLYA